MRNAALEISPARHQRLVSRTLLAIVTFVSWCAVAVASSGMNALPYVSAPLVPTSIKPGGSGFTLTVNGAGFVSGSIVNWNGSPRTTTFVSSTLVTAAILVSDIAKAMTASVTVSNPAPGGGTSNVVFFQVVNQEPAVGLGIKGTCSVAPAASADFNSDGKPDLVAFNVARNDSVSLMLGKGDGTFGNGRTYIPDGIPGRAVVGDFNGDGKADLAITSYDNWDVLGVEIYLGNGDGTLQARINSPTGNFPYGLVAGDFNEDGRLDLAVTNYGSGTVSILFGNGDGTFQPHTDINLGGTPYSIGLSDFNRDGHLDLVVGDLSGFLLVFLGNGDGTFGSPISTPISTGIALAIADLNGDSIPDLVITSAQTASVLLGKEDGTFTDPVAYALPGDPVGIVLNDLNGDGKLDLAVNGVNSVGTTSTSIFLGKGDGSFGSATSYIAAIIWGSMVAGDFNGDGRLDLDNGCDWLQTARAVTFNRASLTFSHQVVSTTSVPQQVKLTNSGAQAVSISAITTSGDFAQTNDCPSTLGILKGCKITVTFTPTATGPRTGSVLVTDDAVNSPQSLPLTGSGSEILLSPASLAFGSQPVGTTSPVQTITVTNEGTDTVHIGLIGVEGLNPTDFAQSNNCPAKIGAGISCTINVTFTPTQTGLRKAFIGLGGQFLTVLMNGTGT